jgi:hypothetical protein
MPPSSKILKFLTTIRGLRASATRSRIAYAVWAGRRGTVAWNSLFNDPEMSGLVTATRYQRPGRRGKRRRGRPSLRYVLTHTGRKLLRDLLKAQAIAQETARKAAVDAQEARQAEIRRVAEDIQAAQNASPKYPSKGRQRSAKDIADRLAWRSKTFLNEQVQPAASMVPIEPVPSAQNDNADWTRYISIPVRAGFDPTMQTSPVDSKSQALLARIAQAGYRVKDGKVLFNGNQWIDPNEWARRMPGILD